MVAMSRSTASMFTGADVPREQHVQPCRIARAEPVELNEGGDPQSMRRFAWRAARQVSNSACETASSSS